MREELSTTDFTILEHALLLQAQLLKSDGEPEAADCVRLRASLLRSLVDDECEAQH